MLTRQWITAVLALVAFGIYALSKTDDTDRGVFERSGLRLFVRPGSAKDRVRAPIDRAWCVVGRVGTSASRCRPVESSSTIASAQPSTWRIEDGWIAVPVVVGKAAALNPELAPEPTASSQWMAAVSASDEVGAPVVEFATLSPSQLKALDRETIEGGRTKLDDFLAPLTLEQLRAQHFAADAGPTRSTSAAFVRQAIANHIRGRGIK